MTLCERQCRFTAMLARLILYAVETRRLAVKIQEVNRLTETQIEYVRNGFSKTMDSCHLLNLAADIFIIEKGVPTKDMEWYRVLGEHWETLGGRWGGRFGVKPQDYKSKIGWDPGHFEARGA